MHGYLGVYDRVSSQVARFLRSQETIPVSKPLYGTWEADALEADDAWAPAESTITALKRRGYLTDKSHDEEVDFFTKYVGLLHEGQLRGRPHYVIMPTYNCNLRCHYCFQDQMRTNPAMSHLLRTMTVDMANRIMRGFSFIEDHLHGTPSNGHAPKRAFTFFGGEPLLKSSRLIVEHIIRSQQRVSEPTFSAVTNGTELDAYEDLLGPTGISHIQITFDGTPPEHDRRRVYPDKAGSFSKIAQNINLALDREVRVSARVNVDRNNVETLPELANELISRGWHERANFSAYLAPISDYSGLKNAGARPMLFNNWELGEVLRTLHRQAPATKVFSRVDGELRERVRTVFRTNGPVRPRSAYCGAHGAMYIFDSFGDIYACWDRTGDKNLRIGKVNDDGSVVINGVGKMWRSRSVASNPTCRQCRYALHCGGGCAVLAEVTSGSIFSNHCNAFGKRFRAVVADVFAEHRSQELIASQ